MAEVSEFRNSVHLQVNECSPENIEQHLRGIDDVADVLYNTSNGSFRLIAKNGCSLVDRVWAVAQSNGWDVRTLSEEKGKLEDVFRQLTGKR